MSLLHHKVGIVVDRNFGPRIATLARYFHVWVIDAPANTPFIQNFWENEQQTSDLDPLSFGITSFGAGGNESLEEVCARIVGDVDEHHGAFSHDPPWSELEVFGVELSSTLQKAFQDIGATSFDSTEHGFICRRIPVGHPS